MFRPTQGPSSGSTGYRRQYIPWNILSPIACWTWWWPLSRPKHVVQLTSFITDQLVVFWLPYTAPFMLHTQRGCLNSRPRKNFLAMRYSCTVNRSLRDKLPKCGGEVAYKLWTVCSSLYLRYMYMFCSSMLYLIQGDRVNTLPDRKHCILYPIEWIPSHGLWNRCIADTYTIGREEMTWGFRRRWYDTIKIDLRELGFDGMKLSRVFQNRGPVAQSSDHTVGVLTLPN